jgi:cytochrome b
MDIHEKVGYSLLCLVATRIIWGFVGSEAARFRAFLFAPRTLLAYLKEGGTVCGSQPFGWPVGHGVAIAAADSGGIWGVQP